MSWYIVGGLIVFAIGVLFFAKPDAIWKYSQSGKPGQPQEPTKSYVKVTRIHGVIYMLLGAGVMAIYLLAM